MDEIKFSIQANVRVNGKELQGNLNIDSRGFAFDSSGRNIFSIKCDWKNAICTRAIEKRSRLLFLKVEKIFYTISFDNFVSNKIFIRSENEKRFNEIIKNVKEYCIREDELKYQEELAYQEAERKRKEELACLEVERKRKEEQEHLLAEKKLQEELLRLAELKRQAEQKQAHAAVYSVFLQIYGIKKNEDNNIRLARGTLTKFLSALAEYKEELACQEEECKRQEELARQEAERKLQENLQEKLSPDYLYILNNINSIKGELNNTNRCILASHVLDAFDVFFNNKRLILEERYEYLIDNLYNIMFYYDVSDQFSKKFINYLEMSYYNCSINVDVILQFVFRLLTFRTDTVKNITVFDSKYDYGLDIGKLILTHQYESPIEDDELLSDQAWKTYMREVIAEQREISRQNHIKEEANRIHEYILEQRRPITRGHLRKKFRSYSGKMMDELLLKGDILDLRGEFLALKNVPITIQETECMRQDIIDMLDEHESICHCSELYDELVYSYNSVFRNSYITDAKKLFGLLQGLFRKELTFEYPYVAMDIDRIPSPEQRLRMFIGENSITPVEDVTEYIRKKHLKINSLLDFLISINDSVLLKNREELISIEALPISEVMVKEIEKLIAEELEEDDEYKAIRDLRCIVKFPALNVPWDEWLIYSALAKWGKEIYLHTTSPQFKYAIPVVSIYGYVDDDDLSNIAEKYSGQILLTSTHTLDDMEDLDDLIIDDIDIDDIDTDDIDIDDIDLMDDFDLEDL